MHTLVERVRAWAGVDFNEPHNQLEAAMVRVLLVGMLALTVVGVFDVLTLQTLDAAIQPLGSTLLGLAAWIMYRTGTARPRTLLAVGAIMAYAFIIFTAVETNYLRLTNASAMVIITASGVLAVALGGRWAALSRRFWTVLIVAAVFTAQWTLGASKTGIIADVATVVTVMAMAYVTVDAVRSAAERGRARYEGLVDTAPVGVAELDFRGVSAWLKRKALRTLSDVDAYLARTPEVAPDILALVNVRVINGVARRLLDVEPGEEASIRLDKTLAAGDSVALAHWCASIAFADPSGQVEFDFPSRKGVQRHYVIRWNVQSPDLSDVIFAVVDFTRQKQAEEALEAEIRSKDQFIASVSHELRTPLTAVVGLVEELVNERTTISGDERDELLRIVAAQSRDVANIVEDLLVAARAAGGTLTVFPEAIDLAETVHDTMQGIGEEFDLELGDEVFGYADAVRTRQIVRNLATNAVRYGGPRRSVVVWRSDEEAHIDVRDNGSPIPDELRQTMFLPYARANDPAARAPESVGLGLTLAASLAQAMDGSLAYSHDGHRSVFRLSLPLSGSPSLARPTQ